MNPISYCRRNRLQQDCLEAAPAWMDVRRADAADAGRCRSRRIRASSRGSRKHDAHRGDGAPDLEGDEGLFVPSRPSAVIARTTAIAARSRTRRRSIAPGDAQCAGVESGVDFWKRVPCRQQFQRRVSSARPRPARVASRASCSRRDLTGVRHHPSTRNLEGSLRWRSYSNGRRSCRTGDAGVKTTNEDC